MEDRSPLTNREIALIEEMGIYKRVVEIDKLIITCLTVRQGGDVLLKWEEIDFTRKNYTLCEEMSHEDFTHDCRFRARLK